MPFQKLTSKRERREYAEDGSTPTLSAKMKNGTTDTGSSRGDYSNSRADGSVVAELTFEDDLTDGEARIWRDRNDDDDFLEDPF